MQLMRQLTAPGTGEGRQRNQSGGWKRAELTNISPVTELERVSLALQAVG